MTTSTRPSSTTPAGTDRPGGKQPGVSGSLLLGYAVLIAFSFVYLYPFVIQIATAFKTDSDAVQNALSLVAGPVHDRGLRRLLDTQFPRWFGNSVLVTCW
jgi:multiple sugar transport system permease protein